MPIRLSVTCSKRQRYANGYLCNNHSITTRVNLAEHYLGTRIHNSQQMSRELVSGSRGLQRPVKVFGQMVQSIYNSEPSVQANSLEASWSIRNGCGGVAPTEPTDGGQHNLRRLAAHTLGTRSMSCIICIYCRRYSSIHNRGRE